MFNLSTDFLKSFYLYVYTTISMDEVGSNGRFNDVMGYRYSWKLDEELDLIVLGVLVNVDEANLKV